MISVFTPFHKKDTSFLAEAFISMKAQTFTDWEWVILLNVEGLNADVSFLDVDERVKIHRTIITGNIGALKKECCSKAEGTYLVEMDYDDLLTPDCLQEIHNAFQDERIQMVYSNCAEFEDKTWKPNTYSEYWGWKMRPFIYEGHALIEMISWAPSVQMMRRIEWAPNHVRAWRTSSYKEIVGHDAKLKVGDDHDLCCRYYLKYGEYGMKHIDKCLYLYRVHPNNNVKLLNAEIQYQTDQNYLKYSRNMAKRWAEDNNLLCIDLGGRFDCPDGFKSVDRMDADLIFDLNKRWELEDNSVGVLRASHIIEHLKNPIHVMNEAFRVLAGGGFLFIDVPSTDGRGAYQDPTHISFFNENSFWYYTNKFYWKSVV